MPPAIETRDLRKAYGDLPDLSVDGVVNWDVEGRRVVVRAHRGTAVAPRVLRTLEGSGLEVAEVDIVLTSIPTPPSPSSPP